MKGLTKEQFLGVVRHTLTFVGGFFVLKGIMDESMMVEVSAGIITLAGTIWSVIDKNK